MEEVLLDGRGNHLVMTTFSMAVYPSILYPFLFRWVSQIKSGRSFKPGAGQSILPSLSPPLGVVHQSLFYDNFPLLNSFFVLSYPDISIFSVLEKDSVKEEVSDVEEEVDSKMSGNVVKETGRELDNNS